jgi:hypothetical protein
MDHGDHIGLTRRELERELAWLLKRLPEDPRELIKTLSHAIVLIIDKNNAAIAKALERRDEHASAPATPHQEHKA